MVLVNTGILQIRSRRIIFYKSEYEGMHSGKEVAYGVIAFGTFLIFGQLYAILV
jgi:hypothetical protein